MREQLRGGDGAARAPAATTDAYARYEVTYPSGDLRVSGMLLVPNGKGPFPAVVLNHGYIEPSIYVTGQGLSREQDYLARAGFVVLHTDYRGHAASDPASPLSRETRLGYTARHHQRRAVAEEGAVRRPRPGGDARPVDGRRRHPQRARREAGAGQGGGRLRLGQLALPRQLRPLDAAGATRRGRGVLRRVRHPAPGARFYRDLSARTYFDRITAPGAACTTAPSTTPARSPGRAPPSGCCARPGSAPGSTSTTVSSTPSARSGRSRCAGPCAFLRRELRA